MARSRRLDDTSLRSVTPVEVEWIDGPDRTGLGPSPTPDASGLKRWSRLASGGLLLLGAALFAVALGARDESVEDRSAAETSADQSTRQAAARRSAPLAGGTAVDGSADVDDGAFIDQLPNVPDSWVEGQVLTWIDASGQLQLRSLETGEVIGVNTLASATLPPLPEHVHLLGSENSTWLLDLKVPARSGKLSNTVRMVRLGSGLDSYGFSSTGENGQTEFFVGSLWGPAMNGLAEVDARHDVFYVPKTGIIVASQDAKSSTVVGSGLEALPSRLGRIVAASPERVAGIHCDDLGRCVGRIARWDGSDEVQVDAAALSLPVVRMSPDSRYVLSGGGSSWNLLDLEVGSMNSWETRFSANDSLVWSPDSSTVFFIADGALLALRVTDPTVPIARVRRVGDIEARLERSDVAVFVEFVEQ